MAFQWNEIHQMIQAMMKKFCQDELIPHLDALDTEQMLPYPIARKMFEQLDMGGMAVNQFKAKIAKERAEAAGEVSEKTKDDEDEAFMGMKAGELAAMRAIPTIELSRHCPGLITALGVSVGLTADSINAKGTFEQRERWVPDLLTLDKVGSWAITEPSSGSDAFGSMRSTAKLDGDSFVLNGQKTFITNGPYADTIVFICKLDNGDDWKDRPVLTFVLDGDTPGLTRGKPFRKMGMHSSPTGELFLQDVRVGMDRLLGEDLDKAIEAGRKGAKDTFGKERTGVSAMALGMVQECLDRSVDYARTRRQFGKRIGDFQLIQQKLAMMEVARVNIENMLFRSFDNISAGRQVSFAAASASKLYCAQTCMQVCLEAVQLMGGYGYMAEYRVEQLARDAKVMQIYGGTDEIQISQVARSLLGPDNG